MFTQFIARAMQKRINLIVTGVGFAVFAEVLADNEQYINELQREQFERGITKEGTPIEPEYADSTKARKRKRGQPTERVTLKDKGNFYASVYTKVYRNYFLTDSDDEKALFLKAKYKGIFGLTIENKYKLLAHIKAQYISKLVQRIKR